MHHQNIRRSLIVGRGIAIIMMAMMTAGCASGGGGSALLMKKAIDPDVRLKLKDNQEIIAFRFHNIVMQQRTIEEGVRLHEVIDIIDVKEEPLVPLMEKFLVAVKAELKLDNIRTLSGPLHKESNYPWDSNHNLEIGYYLFQMQRIVQKGLVLEFDRSWVVFDLDPPLRSSERGSDRVHLRALARLMRFNHYETRMHRYELLWQGVCDISVGGLSYPDFQKPVNPVVQEKLDRAINACAQELTEQFMGK